MNQTKNFSNAINDLINIFITAFVYLLVSLFLSFIYLVIYLFMLSIYCKYLFNNALYVCVKLKTFCDGHF